MPDREPLTATRDELWREHALLLRLAREHQRRANILTAQIQPTLRRIWEIERCRGTRNA